MHCLDKRVCRLNTKEPPNGTHNLDSLYNSFDIYMSSCTALFVSPALDDTTSSSAQNLNIHIRDPQTSIYDITSSLVL